jgi:DeoR family fructose operon transcriptional repressor
MILNHTRKVNIKGGTLVPRNSRKNVEKRRAQLLELLALKGQMSIEALAGQLKVSTMTVRRDVEQLEKNLAVERLGSGMVGLRDRLTEDLEYLKRKASNRREQQLIARAAVALIEPGQVIGLDASVSALELSRLLSSKQGITVVTNSLLIPSLLGAGEGLEIITAGGTLRNRSLSCVGTFACQIIDSFVYDKVFLSDLAVDAQVGLTDTETDEIMVKQSFVNNAKELVVLADRGKLGTVAYKKCVPADKISVLVTDAPQNHPQVLAFQKRGIEVICV